MTEPRAGGVDCPNNATEQAGRSISEVPSEGRISLHQFDLHSLLRALKHIQCAILSPKEAPAATPEDNPDRASTSEDSSEVRNNLLQDAEITILRAADEAATSCQDHPDRAILWSNLANRFRSRYQRSGDPDDIIQVTKWGKAAVIDTPLDHPNRGNRLNNLGNWVHSRYSRLGVLGDLEDAIKWGEEAMATSPDHPDRASRLSNLSVRVVRKYEQLGDPGDLEQAIRRTEEALEATTSTPHHPNRGLILNNLGNLFHTRYWLFGALEDLEKAIEWGEQAVATKSSDFINRAGRLSNLGGIFHSRYMQLGDPNDLEQAIQLGEQAVAAVPLSHPGRASILSSQGVTLHSRFKRFGYLDDIEQAIKLGEEAVAVTLQDDPDRAGRLNSLGYWFHSRYRWFKALEDLRRAIKQAEEALAATPASHVDRAERLKSMGSLFRSRYERLGAPQDLEQAIKLAEEAVAATPPSHPERAGRLTELGIILARRHENLEGAIKQAEELVASTTNDHPERAGRSSKLSVLIARRNDDLEQAIKRGEEALAATSPESLSRASRWNNLGGMIQTRCWQTETAALKDTELLKDIKQAIECREEALDATPLDHPYRAAMLNNLADLLRIRYHETNSDDDIQHSICLNREASHCKLSPPRDRITGARLAALLLAASESPDWQESRIFYEYAVKMLPNVSPRFLERDDQEHTLSEFTRLAADAASVALQTGAEASHCIRLLELGRGVIMGLLIDSRIDISESQLQMENPAVFNTFNRLRTEIDSPLVTMPEGLPDRHTRRRRLQAIDQLEATLISIRRLSGFERFLLPPRSEDLTAMAGEGPIVILNSSQYRSDAIIVTPSGIKALALPKLLYKEVIEKMRQIRELVRGKRSTYPQRNTQMGVLLLWLWDAAVEPVLEELQIGDSSGTRIWWIGVGPLGIAPFHAAGDHSPGSMRNTLSRVISSYISTIKALSYARQKQPEFGGPDSRLLLIAMPTTPSHRPLKNSIPEVEEIARVVKGQTVRLDCPSADQVLEQLPSYHAIHFACHGVSDAQNPSNSHLLLQKDDASGSGLGTGLGMLDRLTVRAISTKGTNTKTTKTAQIAYLSACSTADNSSVALADESIHIASGFQLAGFSHVLATLWESNDGACLQVAKDFYRLLFNEQHVHCNRKVSASFHHAVKKLRDQNLGQPLIWASFIHTGA